MVHLQQSPIKLENPMGQEMEDRKKDLSPRSIYIGGLLLALVHLELGRKGWRRYYLKHIMPKEWGGELEP
jgi:hypothetical protein